MTTWQTTVRYGTKYQRYHTFEVEADDLRGALAEAAERIPERITGEADLVEIRVAVDPDDRRYLGEEEGEPG